MKLPGGKLPTQKFFPYYSRDKVFYVLLTVPIQNSVDLVVSDFDTVSTPTFFDIRILRHVRGKHDNVNIGYLLHTTANVMYRDSYVLAYSQIWKAQANTVDNLSMVTVYKAPDIQIFHGRNAATMILASNSAATVNDGLEM